MGDFKKNERLMQAASEREKKGKSQETKNTIKKLTGKDSERKKDKIISAKVYPEAWKTFTRINRARGMTNNSVVNMLITDYIRENKNIL